MRADGLAACALVLCAVLVASASAEASPKTAHQRLLRLVRSNLHEAAREDPNVGALLETEGIVDEFLDDIQQGFKDFGKGLEEMANDIEDVVRNKVAPALAVKREVFGDGAKKHYRRPVVMFAGVMGLKMEGRATNDAQFCGKPAGKFYTLWINLDKCFAQALAMDILPDGTSVPRSGVDVRVFQGDNNIKRGFMKALKELDGANLKSTFKGAASNVLATVLGKTQYFSRFYHNLKDVFGYKSGVDIFAAPVDWRLNPALHPEVFQDVLMIVEKAFISNKRRRTVFMCHSMGGLVALQFIRLLEQNDPSLLALIKKVAPTETISPRAWALSRIESVLFVNSPLAGSQKIWMNLIGGETLLEPAIHRSTMLEVSRTLDVTSLLAPVMPAFHSLYPPTTALIIEDKAKSKFLQFKYDEFDKALELMSRPAPERAMIARTVGKPELGPGISPPDLIVSGQIKANFITVRNVKTPLTYRYSKKDLPWTADGKLAWDALTTVDPIFENNVEGDGTVPQKSAEYFYNWKSSTGTAVVVEDCHALKPRTNPKAICHWVSPLEAKLNEHQSIVYFNKEVIKQMVAHAVTLEPVDEPRTIPNEGVKGPPVKGEHQQQQFQALAGAAFGAVKQ